MKTAQINYTWDDFCQEYIENWHDDEEFSDIKLAVSKDQYEYAIYILQSAGYFDGTPEHVDYWVNYALADFDFRKENDLLLRNVEVWKDQYNTCAFIPANDPYCCYFIDANDLTTWGFSFHNGYDADGKEYAETRL